MSAHAAQIESPVVNFDELFVGFLRTVPALDGVVPTHF
jgi:hypothetical protein